MKAGVLGWAVMAGLLGACAVGAQEAVWQPGEGHTQVRIWPAAAPDGRAMKGPERVVRTDPKDFVAGRSWLSVERVSVPTMTVYAPPAARNTGVAVVVFPGGGYEILAIDLEGSEVCDWLVSRGMTCVLLKYRVPAVRSAPDWGAYPQSAMALEDAQRTIRLVRARAAEMHIDPHKIGVMGFSAGGHLVAATSVHWGERLYQPVDTVDRESCRPDFAVALYPGHLSRKEGTLQLNADISQRISAQTPPTFLLQNEDDHVDTVWDALSYEAALLRAGVPVEFHSYSTGGHAFGLRATAEPATHWPELVETWLRTIGMLPTAR